MRKSTAAISLVLIGSALFVGGCSKQRHVDEEEEDETGGGYHSSGRHGGPFLWHGGSVAGRSGAAGRGVSGASVSARGGFGGMGHAAVGG